MQVALCIFPKGVTLLHSIVERTLKRPLESEEKDLSEEVIHNLTMIATSLESKRPARGGDS